MFAVKSQPEEVFGLPNIKSAKKRVQLAEVRNARNKADKSALKTALKKFEAAAAEGWATRSISPGQSSSFASLIKYCPYWFFFIGSASPSKCSLSIHPMR